VAGDCRYRHSTLEAGEARLPIHKQKHTYIVHYFKINTFTRQNCQSRRDPAVLYLVCPDQLCRRSHCLLSRTSGCRYRAGLLSERDAR